MQLGHFRHQTLTLWQPVAISYANGLLNSAPCCHLSVITQRVLYQMVAAPFIVTIEKGHWQPPMPSKQPTECLPRLSAASPLPPMTKKAQAVSAVGALSVPRPCLTPPSLSPALCPGPLSTLRSLSSLPLPSQLGRLLLPLLHVNRGCGRVWRAGDTCDMARGSCRYSTPGPALAGMMTGGVDSFSSTTVSWLEAVDWTSHS